MTSRGRRSDRSRRNATGAARSNDGARRDRSIRQDASTIGSYARVAKRLMTKTNPLLL